MRKKPRTSLGSLATGIASTVVLYGAGEISPGSLAPRYEQNCRCAPSFKLATAWVPPNRRYTATTVAAYMGEPYTVTFQAALNLLEAHERGNISQEVFDAIISGKTAMSNGSLRALAAEIR